MKYLEECIGKDKLSQQKGFVKSLINENNNLIGKERIMSYEREFVLDEDKEELACFHGQMMTDEIENRNFIQMKSDEVVSQRDWTCEREGGSSVNEGEISVP